MGEFHVVSEFPVSEIALPQNKERGDRGAEESGLRQGVEKGVDLLPSRLRHALWALFPVQERHERGGRYVGSLCRICTRCPTTVLSQAAELFQKNIERYFA